MTRRPTPANLALEDQILAVLRDAGGDRFLATWEVAEAVGHPSSFERSAVVYPRLHRLRRAGRVQRGTRPGFRCVYWRLTVYEPRAP